MYACILFIVFYAHKVILIWWIAFYSLMKDWKFSSCFDLVTFKFVNMMMDLGVTRQLDFKDLVELPCDLMPSSCCNTLLRCWVAEQNKHNSNPSLFRAMCYAYGWPYLRLGLLKVLPTPYDNLYRIFELFMIAFLF